MISIVIPIYNEGKNIEPFYTELKSVVEGSNCSFEIIFIDDGSTDDTWNILTGLVSPEGHQLKIIKLRSRSGKSAALQAGFNSSLGDIIVTLDGDGQDNPADIPHLLDEMTDNIDVIIGWRYQRKDKFLSKRLPSKIYNHIVRKLFGVPFHDNNCPIRAYKKHVLQDIFLYKNYHRLILPILYFRGYKIKEVKVNHRERMFGKSKYSMLRLVSGLLDVINAKLALELEKHPQKPRFLLLAIVFMIFFASLATTISLLNSINSIFSIILCLVTAVLGVTVSILAKANSLTKKMGNSHNADYPIIQRYFQV